MDEETGRKALKIGIGFIIILVIIIIVGIIILIIYRLVGNVFYTGKSFVGLTGSYKNYKDMDKDALVVLYNKNKDLMDLANTTDRMDIKRVEQVYEDFVTNCDKSRCPVKVYNSAQIMLDYIEYQPDFSAINGNAWQQVRLGLSEMDKLLEEMFFAIDKLSDTVAGSGDNYLSELKDQYDQSLMEKQGDIKRIIKVGDFEPLEADQIATQMKEAEQYRIISGVPDDSYQNSLAPNNGNLSAFEYLVAEGREKPFNGNVREWSRSKNKQVLNDTIVEEEKHDVDMRYARPGLMGTIRNHDTISNYNGRSSYTFEQASYNKNCSKPHQ